MNARHIEFVKGARCDCHGECKRHTKQCHAVQTVQCRSRHTGEILHEQRTPGAYLTSEKFPNVVAWICDTCAIEMELEYTEPTKAE